MHLIPNRRQRKLQVRVVAKNGLTAFCFCPTNRPVIRALNFIGLYENGMMKRALQREFEILVPQHRGYSIFVGFATPGYAGLLDPHEDVGILFLGQEEFQFIGESRSLRATRNQVDNVQLKANIHTWIGLGGWVRVRGTIDGKPYEWRFEPREKDSLLANSLLRRKLRDHIANWKKRNEPHAV